jgi:hypothetical protein
MANAILWQAAWVDRGDLLTTGLNSLANGARSAAGTELDNSANLDQYAAIEIYLASLTPTTGGYVSVYMITAPDGTNYAEGSDTIDPGTETLVAVFSLRAATGVVRKTSELIRLPPAKLKLLLLNNSGAALASSGNLVALFTSNDEIQ